LPVISSGSISASICLAVESYTLCSRVVALDWFHISRARQVRFLVLGVMNLNCSKDVPESSGVRSMVK
jgi:hypothetical protein